MSFRKTICCILLLGSLRATQEAYITNTDPLRDISWRPHVLYNSSSRYALFPSIELGGHAYKEKIALIEERRKGNNYLFKLFNNIVPSEWNPNVTYTSIWTYDPFDALVIGIETAQADIVQASLAMLPISRAISKTGNTTNLRNQPIVVNDKFDIRSQLEQCYKAMNSTINKLRVIKWLGAAASILALGGQAKNSLSKNLLPDAAILFDISKSKYATFALSAASFVTTDYVQRKYIRGFVDVLKTLMNSDKVTFDKKQAKEHLIQLKNKLSFFSKASREELATIIEAL